MGTSSTDHVAGEEAAGVGFDHLSEKRAQWARQLVTAISWPEHQGPGRGSPLVLFRKGSVSDDIRNGQIRNLEDTLSFTRLCACI